MKDATITIRVTEQEKEQLKAAVAKTDLSISQLVRRLIKAYLDNPSAFRGD